MITTVEYIRLVRPIAQNIDGLNRIEPYIREAEALNILPQIGAAVYRWLDETDFNGAGPWVFSAPDGRAVTITKEQHDAILFGGYYNGPCQSGHSMGLVAASSYYAYSRAVLDNQVNVTSFGVVKKRSEYSDPVDSSTLVQVSREAKKLGDEVTREVIEHLRSLGLVECDHKPQRVPHFMAVAPKKM